ncbi:MAG: hypothetical protein CL569_03100 [Alphaproteobacteria bacterium]|nr:hypothetical protein [Alphaproteobacteria bacterium]|tara:strand:+ start:9257 stop:10054 length:798 start_codon:yes stop_codon:yes gene_type:complete
MTEPNNPEHNGESSEDETPHLIVPAKTGVLHRLRNYFLTGIIITAPLGITIFIAWKFIGLIDSWVTPFIPATYNPETYLPFDLPGLGLLFSIVVLTLIGALTASFTGRILVRFGERLVARMPVIRAVYGALKQIFETVLAQSSKSFREVVLVEYPRRGIWAIAFVTGHTEGEVQNLTEDDLVNVFLPTTPNPTSGFLLFLPRRALVTLNMTVEEGIKLVISGGIVTPPDPRPQTLQDVPQITSREGEAAAERAQFDTPARAVGDT